MKVLFVCLGNICRSPTAAVVLRAIAAQEARELKIDIDSAGTAGYHIGAAPDARSQEAARRRGYDMSALRARMVAPEDFERFDLILAMDKENLAVLRGARRARATSAFACSWSSPRSWARSRFLTPTTEARMASRRCST